jgi:hypothetical protein
VVRKRKSYQLFIPTKGSDTNQENDIGDPCTDPQAICSSSETSSGTYQEENVGACQQEYPNHIWGFKDNGI